MNLANCLADAGDIREAAKLDTETYGRFGRLFMDDHPDTLAAGANLAQSLEAIREPGQARELRHRILPMFARRLGEEHPTTVAARNGERIDREIEPQPV
jgi:hypothetical protein